MNVMWQLRESLRMALALLPAPDHACLHSKHALHATTPDSKPILFIKLYKPLVNYLAAWLLFCLLHPDA